jgi:hypothetical protein
MKSYKIKFNLYEQFFTNANNTLSELFFAESIEAASLMCFRKYANGVVVDILAISEA